MSVLLALTVDEAVSYLAHTEIPTLLVEGSGDLAVLRRVERELRGLKVDVLPVGGKGRLVPIADRRAEFAGKAVRFLRDRDEWVAIGIPPGNDHLIFTEGYSIENDVLDRQIVAAIAGDRSALVSVSVALVAEWFRSALQHYVLDGNRFDITRDFSVLVDQGALTEQARADVLDELAHPFSGLELANSWVWLRGRTLLRIVQGCLEKGNPSYSKDQIVDLCIKLGPSEAFRRLVERVGTSFS